MTTNIPNISTGSDDHSLGDIEQISMKTLFEHAGRIGASDLLITVGTPPIVRVNGELTPVIRQKLDASQTRHLIWSLLNETQQEMFERKRELDFSLAVTGNLRFRANVYYQKGTVAGAFRIIPRTIPDLQTLGLPPVVPQMTLRTHGLILVTGATGSGKSTTMASMIDLINNTRRCHVVTVEDPIEFVHENRKAVIDQREVFADTLSFSNALKYVLRQDPDVILVGEMRDMETIASAITAAETGHLVIATMHTNDAVQSIANSTETNLAFNQERWDTDAIHDPSTNNSRLTCKTAGKYLITGNARFAGHVTGERDLIIVLNGTTPIGETRVASLGANPTYVQVTAIYDLAVNDYVELAVWQNSEGALDIQVTGNTSPEFMMAKIRG